MKILSAAQIRELDAYTIKQESISSVDHMERASSAFVSWFTCKFDRSTVVNVFCGPGNNGGDGLAISRILLKHGYYVLPYILFSDRTSEDFKVNEQRLRDLAPILYIRNERDIPAIDPSHVVIDAIFGSGLTRAITGVFSTVIEKINSSLATVVSVDIASGLFCDQPNLDTTIVRADYTITFQLPKLSMLLPANGKYTGELNIVDIGLNQEFIAQATSGYFFTDNETIRPLVRKREKFSHKGTFGTSLLIGGSFGMIGAAVLMAKACLRTGTGLCVSYLPGCGYNIMQAAVPENMVITDPEYNFISDIPDLEKYSSIGVGPGLGRAVQTVDALKKLIEDSPVPLVIDADGLNILSESKEWLSRIPGGSILTPHPKEFQRLAGASSNDYHRLELLRDFALKTRAVVILKGAYTAIASPEGNIYFNSTGNPGMATGGSGDVLTGIITSLRAQGYEALPAAILGVYLHGFAGDRAAEKMSEPSMIASDIIDHIPDFFQKFY